MKKLARRVKEYLPLLILSIGLFIAMILTFFKIISINVLVSSVLFVFTPILELKLKHSERINSLFNSVINMSFEQVVTLMEQYKYIEFQYIPNEPINYLYAYFNMKFLGTDSHTKVYATYLQKIPITISGEKDEDKKENNNFKASLLTRIFKEKMHEMGNKVPYYWVVLPATCTNLYRCIKRASFVPRKRIKEGLYKLCLVPLTKYQTPFINFELIINKDLLIGIPTTKDRLDTGICIRNSGILSAFNNLMNDYWNNYIIPITRNDGKYNIEKIEQFFQLLTSNENSSTCQSLQKKVKRLTQSNKRLYKKYFSEEKSNVFIKKSYVLFFVLCLFFIGELIVDNIDNITTNIGILLILFETIIASTTLIITLIIENEKTDSLNDDFNELKNENNIEFLPLAEHELKAEVISNQRKTQLNLLNLYQEAQKEINSTYFNLSLPFYEKTNLLRGGGFFDLQKNWNAALDCIVKRNIPYKILLYIESKEIYVQLLDFLSLPLQNMRKSSKKDEESSVYSTLWDRDKTNELLTRGKISINIIAESFVDLKDLKEKLNLNELKHPLVPIMNIHIIDKQTAMFSFATSCRSSKDDVAFVIKANETYERELINNLYNYYTNQLWGNSATKKLLDDRKLDLTVLERLAKLFDAQSEFDDFNQLLQAVPGFYSIESLNRNNP